MTATLFESPKISSITARTRCTFSSPICTKIDPDSVSRPRATIKRSRKYVRYEWMPSRQVSRNALTRSEEHTSELQSLMRISYAVFCLKKKQQINKQQLITTKINNNNYTTNM